MKFASLCLFACALGFAPRADAVVIYGVTSADNESVLYTIDPTTGVALEKGSLGVDRVSAIDFHPDGTLYGITSSDYTLRKINTTTGASSWVADIAFNHVYTDMTFTSDGVLYGQAKSQLYVIDSTDGTEMPIGDGNGTGGSGNAAAISPDGKLYFAVGNGTNFDFYKESVEDGSLLELMGTNTHAPLTANSWRLSAMDFDPVSGDLWGILIGSSELVSPAYLVKIDPDTGQLLPAFPGETYFVQTTSGMDAIAIAVPEPATVGLLAGCAALVWALHRRHRLAA